jgi:hypothetical protein
MEAWKGGGWRRASKGFAVPLTKLQIHALRVLAAQRSPDSYLTAAEADGAALAKAGLELSWGTVHTGKRQAQIQGLGGTMQLEWVADRFQAMTWALSFWTPTSPYSPICGR